MIHDGDNRSMVSLPSVRGAARIQATWSGADDFAPEIKKRQNKSRHPTGHQLLSCFSLASSTAPRGCALDVLQENHHIEHVRLNKLDYSR